MQKLNILKKPHALGPLGDLLIVLKHHHAAAGPLHPQSTSSTCKKKKKKVLGGGCSILDVPQDQPLQTRVGQKTPLAQLLSLTLLL